MWFSNFICFVCNCTWTFVPFLIVFLVILNYILFVAYFDLIFHAYAYIFGITSFAPPYAELSYCQFSVHRISSSIIHSLSTRSTTLFLSILRLDDEWGPIISQMVMIWRNMFVMHALSFLTMVAQACNSFIQIHT